MPKVASQPSRRELLALLACSAAASAVAFPGTRASASGQFRITKAPADWRRQLGSERFHILREAGTEYAYSSPLNSEHRAGIFACAGCAQPLFSSSTKFDSHTGWPSFYRPLPRAVVTKTDDSLFMARTEVLCARCGGHLGHVFNDGPRPTGLRYCMNGLAMTFAPGRAA